MNPHTVHYTWNFILIDIHQFCSTESFCAAMHSYGFSVPFLPPPPSSLASHIFWHTFTLMVSEECAKSPCCHCSIATSNFHYAPLHNVIPLSLSLFAHFLPHKHTHAFLIYHTDKAWLIYLLPPIHFLLAWLSNNFGRTSACVHTLPPLRLTQKMVAFLTHRNKYTKQPTQEIPYAGHLSSGAIEVEGSFKGKLLATYKETWGACWG